MDGWEDSDDDDDEDEGEKTKEFDYGREFADECRVYSRRSRNGSVRRFQN